MKYKVTFESCKVNHVGDIFHIPLKHYWVTLEGLQNLLKKYIVDDWDKEDGKPVLGYYQITVPFTFYGKVRIEKR